VPDGDEYRIHLKSELAESSEGQQALPRPFVADEPDITYGRALNEIRVGDDDTGRSPPQPRDY